MAQYLIDTQILIWFELGSPKLKTTIYDIIANSTNEIFVSQISLMEIAIKQTTGKLIDLHWDTKTIVNQLQKDNFVLLSIQESHISTYRQIPFFEQHRDPFDRFLLATSIAESMPIVSADANFGLYSSLVHVVKA